MLPKPSKSAGLTADSIRLTEARARPDAAGVVRRHQPKYGRRGALKAFVVGILQEAAAGLTTRDVALAAAIHFELPLVSEAEFLIYLNNTVRAQLNKLAGRAWFQRRAPAGRAQCGRFGSGGCPPWPNWRCSPAPRHHRWGAMMPTRPRPDIKWLINETAMLQGELERIDQEMAPAQLNTAQRAEKALVRFELTMSCPAELYDFKMNTVGRRFAGYNASCGPGTGQLALEGTGGDLGLLRTLGARWGRYRRCRSCAGRVSSNNTR